MKMHLAAKVPNEGARRLAWWIGSTKDAAERLDRRAAVNAAMADRLLAGEVLPGGEMGHLIWLLTDGQVPTAAWRRPPHGGWFDKPLDFHEQEARGGSPLSPARAGEVGIPLRASPAPVPGACA